MAWAIYAAYGSFLAGSYIYHRWINPPPKPKPAREIELARTDEGATIPMIYGRCRVRAPLLAWASVPQANDTDDVSQMRSGMPFLYEINLLYVLGTPVKNGTNKIYQIWAGENRLTRNDSISSAHPCNLSDLTGNGNFESSVRDPVVYRHDPAGQGFVGGRVEFLNGNGSQQLRNPTTPFAATTKAGEYMTDGVVGNVADPSEIPGYRGYMLAFLYNRVGIGWAIGTSPNPPAFTFEASSYPSDSDAFNVGLEMNPAKVLLDILTNPMAKLGMPTSRIDLDTFASAKVRLQEEGNGYSRCIEDTSDARDDINEILEQIDGVMYEDPITGKTCLKLIRDDYDVASLIGVTTENCFAIENYAAGGFTSTINKVRVVFSDRAADYRDGGAVAHNQANAVGQDGEVREVILNFPGVCTQPLANAIAARELAARSRPIAKCRAIVDRTFYRTVPGDPVRVTWPEYGIDGRVFRVAAVNRGTLSDGRIQLELIEDFFYSWRNVLVPGHVLDPFPGHGGVIGGG